MLTHVRDQQFLGPSALDRPLHGRELGLGVRALGAFRGLLLCRVLHRRHACGLLQHQRVAHQHRVQHQRQLLGVLLLFLDQTCLTAVEGFGSDMCPGAHPQPVATPGTTSCGVGVVADDDGYVQVLGHGP
ncbi:hypothetical protein ACFFX0_23365 [Citricoccus parietis]|uniref:Uncharacterized protein n=1 Tax=Citricoccus parietis TaxID=592307 RepID=A0ABV5G501_9MICC